MSAAGRESACRPKCAQFAAGLILTQSWNEIEFQDLWSLSPEESALLPGMTDKGRLGFAVQLKFMEIHGRFPERHDEIDPSAVQCLGTQLGAPVDMLSAYELDGRQGRRHRRTIRNFFGFRPASGSDLQDLGQWLTDEVLPLDPQARHGRDLALDWCRAQRLEPPALDHLQRIIRSAVYQFEAKQHETIYARLTAASKAAIDRLLAGDEPESEEAETESTDSVSLSGLKSDPGKPGLDNLLTGIAKLQCINGIELSTDVFEGVSAKFIDQFRQRCATESMRELRRHPPAIRYSMVAMFCWQRRQQVTDLLLDLLLQVIHNLGTRAEKKIDQRQFVQFRKVRGKARLLFKLAEATVDQPDGIIKEVVYPVVGQKTLQELVAEFKAIGFEFDREVQEQMRSSYGHH
jgi:hypothetical protein